MYYRAVMREFAHLFDIDPYKPFSSLNKKLIKLIFYGCDDMIGNAMEWTGSSYGPYPDARATGLLYNKDHMVARGAGFNETNPSFSLCTTRVDLPRNTRLPMLGFRCVKDVE